MANLNLPGHNSSWLSLSSYLLYMDKTYPAISRAQSSWHMWLEMAPVAIGGPTSSGPWPLQTWGRGNNLKPYLEQQEIFPNMERREKGEARSEQQITQPAGTT